jgi:hypothetical protein
MKMNDHAHQTHTLRIRDGLSFYRGWYDVDVHFATKEDGEASNATFVLKINDHIRLAIHAIFFGQEDVGNRHVESLQEMINSKRMFVRKFEQILATPWPASFFFFCGS